MHEASVVVQVADGRLQLLELCSAQVLFGGHLFEAADDPAHVASEDSLQALTDKLPRLVTPLGVEAVGRLPDALQHMEDVQDADDSCQVGGKHFPQGALTVHDADHRLFPLGIDCLHLLLEPGDSRASPYGPFTHRFWSQSCST